MDVVYFDLKKAFDRVYQSRLLAWCLVPASPFPLVQRAHRDWVVFREGVVDIVGWVSNVGKFFDKEGEGDKRVKNIGKLVLRKSRERREVMFGSRNGWC